MQKIQRYETETGLWLNWFMGDWSLYASAAGHTNIDLPEEPQPGYVYLFLSGVWEKRSDSRGWRHDPETGEERWISSAAEMVPAGWVAGRSDLAAIASARERARADIDDAAGAARLRYITAVPGQDATYTAKYADAVDYLRDGSPADASPYTWVAAEASATGQSPAMTATQITQTGAYWEAVIGPRIEAARIGAKAALAGLATIEAIEAHVAAAVAALEAI